MTDAIITLRDVTADNWEEVVDLELAPGQEAFVATNSYSLAEAKFNPYAIPRAIYAGRKLVGFLMYESLGDEDKPHHYAINRLMIDRRHQGKGYGRRAMEQVIAEIKRDARLKLIRTCYTQENAVSKRFYASLGFKEAGRNEDGEIEAVIRF